MICPFCQHELDVDGLACPRCHTAYGGRLKTFGFSVRMVTVTVSMCLVMSLILVDCVINYLPGGRNSTIPVGSAQLPIQPLPNLKTPSVTTLLNEWQQGQQNVPTPGFVK